MKVLEKMSHLIFIFLIFFINYDHIISEGFIPEKGFVPDSITACKIAEIILKPIYGDKNIENQKPFIVNLSKENVWIIKGNRKKFSNKKIVFLGGVFEIHIRKSDCKILNVIHGK